MVVCTRCRRGEREGWRWWMGVAANQEGCDWCTGVSCGASLQSCYVSMWPVIDMNGMPVRLPLLGTLCSDFCMTTMWTSEVQVVVPFSQDHKAFLYWKIHNFYWIDASGNMKHWWVIIRDVTFVQWCLCLIPLCCTYSEILKPPKSSLGSSLVIQPYAFISWTQFHIEKHVSRPSAWAWSAAGPQLNTIALSSKWSH